MSGQATVTIGTKQWTCLVASTSAELTAGLSGVASLAANNGMLFDLGGERLVTVNAFEMLFPLSVVFINEELKVTEVIPLLAIGDEITSVLPCRYFVEMNVGESIDVAPGDTVTIAGYTPPSSTANSVIELMLTMVIVTMMMQMIMETMEDMKI